MKVSREQVLENKRTILAAAGRLFRERGFEAVTVTDVMKSAGLTHGGFYGYFKSKDDLIVQALAEVLGDSVKPSADLVAAAEQYLLPEHRDNFAGGCPIAALASECVRQTDEVRAEMTAGLKRQFEDLSRIAHGKDETERRRNAIGNWGAMVGALILARTSNDSQLSDEILNQTKAWLALQVSTRPRRAAKNKARTK
jgi:TetR/AcrR family transcriptional repressor of nem operon